MADGHVNGMSIGTPVPLMASTVGAAHPLAQARLEAANAIRAVAATEIDPQVVARLHVVAAMVAQALSQVEAEKAVAEAGGLVGVGAK